MKLVVCGLPGSGNHLAVARAIAAGADAKQDHGGTSKGLPYADALLVTYRLDEAARLRSVSRRGHSRIWNRERDADARANVLKAMQTTDWRVVCYEDIMRTRGAALDQALLDLGLDLPPWPTEAVNEEPWMGPVFASDEERLASYKQGK